MPNETRSPFKTSGIRLGTPALTTRGLLEDDIAEVAGLIDRAIRSKGDESIIAAVNKDVLGLCERFPMGH